MKTRNVIKNAILFSILLLFHTNSASSAETSPTLSIRSLTPSIANKIVVAAVTECTKRGYSIAAAVVGRDGNLLAFLRHPLSGPHTVLVSQRKAYSAATFQVSTSEMGSRPDLSFAPGVLLVVGGVPISVGGYFYGGAGVSGADPKSDEQCAEAGISAIREILEFAE